ncbi:MAG: PIN domain-containing protein [Arachidicoccus sp.]|nr:PIN domain-containing protein [Arachidicoccus sp.]
MNGHKILVDTNIILYLLDGNKEISDKLSGKDVYISFISELELLSFSKLEQEEIIHLLLNNCKIISYNEWIKESTIQIRKVNKLKLPDSNVLARAKFLDVPLFTGDKKLAKAKGVSDIILYEEKNT